MLGFGFDHVVIATGARWRRDGVGRRLQKPLPVAPGARVMNPDDLLAGLRPEAGPVVIFDDDHYYMGGVLAELLAREGREVALVTPTGEASSWMEMTMEQHRVQARLLELGVTIVPHRLVTAVAADHVTLACVYTGRTEPRPAATTVMVTARLPENTLAKALEAQRADWADAGLASVTLIGDALAPARSRRPSGRAGALPKSSTPRPAASTICPSCAKSPNSPPAPCPGAPARKRSHPPRFTPLGRGSGA